MSTGTQKAEETTERQGEASDSFSDVLCGDNFAVFAYSESEYGSDGEMEQLTHWASFDNARKSKDSWFQTERHTFILARIRT